MDFHQVAYTCFAFVNANDGSIITYPAQVYDKLELHTKRIPRTEIIVERDSKEGNAWQVKQVQNSKGVKTSDARTVRNVSELTAQLSQFWHEGEDSSDAADTICEIFVKHLPSVGMITARDFSSAMRTYYAAFQTLRASCMNYEELPEYRGGSFIMQIPSDHYWPYTPHFRKLMALVIEDLFTTTITSLCTSACEMEQSLAFVDNHKNRWHVTVRSASSDENMIRIEMYFPRSNTETISHGKPTRIEHLIDSAYLKENNLAIITEDLNYLLGRAEIA
jgi:hypothetical protein